MPTLLLPLDGTPQAEVALVGAQALTRNQRWTVRTLFVGDDPEGAQLRYLEKIAGLLSQMGHEVTPQVLAGGDPAEGILDAAKVLPADLVILKRDEREGIAGWMLGSITDRVARDTTAPLLLMNPKPGDGQWVDYAVRHILVPLDGSAASEAAIDLALRFAEPLGARVSVMHSVPWRSAGFTAAPELIATATWSDAVDKELEASMLSYLEGVVGRYADRVRLGSVAMRGRPADSIGTAVANHEIDLVVMTTSGAGAVGPLRMGSVAEGVVAASEAPVILVRPSA